MQEKYDYVQRGFRILLPALSGFLGQSLHRVYGDQWWEDVLSTLSDQYDLPSCGSYETLIDSLDIANCLRLIERKWNAMYRNMLDMNCRTWSKELMGVRNMVAHIGNQDLDQLQAERAVNTMYFLCKELDEESAEELLELFHQIRGENESETVSYEGLAQPETSSNRGKKTEGSLLNLVGTELVKKTALTKKVTFGNKTEIYPVYQVSLDVLFYNDQNDRIATWISRYEAENGQDSLKDLQTDTYNRIIENFIYESNPESIRQTQNKILILGQQVPGVALSDGRVVDGNRRFTCLRRLQREQKEPQYFETVIMDMDIEADQKQIKLLELAIQHGEEAKVDYDQIDYAIGTYRDIVQTKLLTIEEYVEQTQEKIPEVRKRIAVAELITEFLSEIQLPEQYYAAREYQVYEIFKEMLPTLNQLNAEDQAALKNTVFDNAILKAIPDQRKFIREIKGLVKQNTYAPYFEAQKAIHEELQKKIQGKDIHKKEDLDAISQENRSLAARMETAMERALQHSRNQQLKERPTENLNKAIGLLLDVDPRLFGKLEPDDVEMLKGQLEELNKITKNFQSLL